MENEKAETFIERNHLSCFVYGTGQGSTPTELHGRSVSKQILINVFL